MLPFHDGEEGGSNRHFRLAVTDIAADEAIHGPFLLHVSENIFNGFVLIRSLLEWERGLKFAVEMIRRRKGMAFTHLAGRIDHQQLLGHRQNRFAGLGLNLLPRASPKPVQTGPRSISADIFLDQIDPIDRQVEPIASFIFEMEKLSLNFCYAEKFEPPIDADSVVQMNHIVILLELA